MACCAEVAEDLCAIRSVEVLSCFDLNDNEVVDDHVWLSGAMDRVASESHAQLLTLDDLVPCFSEGVSEAFLIDVFAKAGAHFPVDDERDASNALAQAYCVVG